MAHARHPSAPPQPVPPLPEPAPTPVPAVAGASNTRPAAPRRTRAGGGADEPIVTRRLRRPNGEIAFHVRGRGPLVLCVPGLGDLRGSYAWLEPLLLAAGYRVVAMDVRGHGDSSVGWDDHSAAAVGSDIVALLERLAGEGDGEGAADADKGAVVIGTSMAAAAAVWAAAERPALVRGLVLVGPFVRDLPPSWAQRLALPLLLRGPWRVAAWTAYYRSLFRSRRPEGLDAHLRRLRASLAEPGRFAALVAMVRASKADCEARLDEVRAATLVLMGERDPDFPDPAAEARWLAQRLRGEARLVAGAGHYPHAERAEAVAPFVLALLARAFGGSAGRGA